MQHLEKIITQARYSKRRSEILLGGDILIVVVSLLISGVLNLVTHEQSTSYTYSYSFLLFVIGMIFVYGSIFLGSNIHRSLWTYIGAKEVMSIAKAVLLASTIQSALLLLLSVPGIPIIPYTIASACLIILGMSGMRIAYRTYRENVQLKSDPTPRQRALIIGANESGYILLKELQRNIRLHTNVIGFIDSNRVGRIINGLPVLGGVETVFETIKQHDISLVYVTEHSLSSNRLKKLIKELSEENVQIKIMKFNEESNKRYGTKSIADVSLEDLLGRGQVKLDQNEVASYLKTKAVLVTGAGGSIGSQIVREVMRFHPRIIYMLDVNENGLYLLDRELAFIKQNNTGYEETEIVPLVVNIRERETLYEVFKLHDIDVVFHAAAHKHVPLMEARPQEAIKNNIFGTNNVMECALAHKVERFIMISTDKAVNPTNVMGASKRMTEILMQSKATKTNTKMAAVRFGNVLGSNGSVVPIFTEQIKKGGPVTITSREITRYFMTIPEATQLVLQAGYYADEGDIFVLDMGKPVKIIDLAENLIKLSGYEPYTEIDIVETGLRPGEKMYEELFLDGEEHVRTKNDLIFRSQNQPPTKEQVDKSLVKLNKAITNNASAKALKEEIFLAIGQPTKLEAANE